MTQHILTLHNYLLNPINELVSAVKSIYDSWVKSRLINETINELNTLTDKELNDIGLSRGDIYSVAAGDVTLRRGVHND